MSNDNSDQSGATYAGQTYTKEQTADMLGEVWKSLSLIVRINNAFIDQMQGGNDLPETDKRRFEQWARALAKAQEPALRVMAVLGPPDPETKLN